MNYGYLPGWLYGVLPYSYLLFGALAIAVLQNRIAVASGLMLIAVGCAVVFLRRRRRPRARPVAAAAVDRKLLEVCWKAEYESGDRLLDEKRRRLFGLCNELVDAASTRKSKADVEMLLHDFYDRLAAHFAAEEQSFAQRGRPLDAAHLDIHRNLLARTANLTTQFRAGNLVAGELIGFISHDILTDHIVLESRGCGSPRPMPAQAEPWTDTERQRREGQDTLLQMVRADPEPEAGACVSLRVLDNLTPRKALFSSYPHVWQRVCAFAQQPRHLERYLGALLGEEGKEGAGGFSLPALKEIGDIYTYNLRFLDARFQARCAGG